MATSNDRRDARRQKPAGASKVAALLLLLSLASAEAAKLPVSVTFAPPENGTAGWLLAQAKNATKNAVVGRVVAPVAAASLDIVEDAGSVAASAQRSFDKKLAAAGLPTTAATAALVKNATVVPARSKATAAVKALRNATDTLVDGAWDEAARVEYDLAQRKRPQTAVLVPTNTSVYVPPRDKVQEALVAGKAASIQARETKRDIEDAAFSSDQGKERFAVLVSLDVAFDPKSDNGVDGTAASRAYPLLSELLAAKESAAAAVRTAVATKIANISAAIESAAADGGVRPSSSSVAASAVVPAVSSVSSFSSVSSSDDVTAARHPLKPGRRATPVTRPIKPAPGESGDATVSFSAEVVAGRKGDSFFTANVVNPEAVADAVRALLVSKLRRLASNGSTDASALLALSDGSTNGLRTAAPLLSARSLSLDAGQGVYLVGISFPALLPGAPLPLPATSLRNQLINAVNDADPSDPCRSLTERTGFDVCGAIDNSTHLTVSGARLQAVEVTRGAAANFADDERALLTFGRRSRSGAADKPSARNRARSGGVVAVAGGGDVVLETTSYAKKIFAGGAKVSAALGQPELAGYFKVAGTAAGYIASGYSLVSKIFGFGKKKKPGPPEPVPNPNVGYFEEVKALSNKILVELDEISDTIDHIERDLGNALEQLLDAFKAEILDTQCKDLITKADTEVNLIRNRWLDYNTNVTGGVRISVEQSMMAISNNQDPGDLSKVYEPWVTNIFAANTGLYYALNNLHKSRLVPEIPGSQEVGLIALCANAAVKRFRNTATTTSATYSFDDRQYFTPIENLLDYYQIWQARGLQMLQEAYLYRAQEAALKAWAENQQVPGCDSDDPNVDRTQCILDAEQLPIDGPRLCIRLQEASGRLPPNFNGTVGNPGPLDYCRSYDVITDEITANVYAQQELSGIPYSWGNEGEGVRLVLGSDITSRSVNIPGNVTHTTTEWLVPASPGAFLSECADPSTSGSCPLLGYHNDSSFGFTTGQQGYPLGYAADLWQPAGAEVWVNGLRGSQPLDAGATGDAASLLALMENAFESTGAVPFRNIRDRFWWIANATTDARLATFGLAGIKEGGKDVVPIRDARGTRVGSTNLPYDGFQAPGDRYYLPKEMAIKSAYCFVAVNATDTTNGASGVVCASEDFRGVFQGKCEAPSTATYVVVDTGIDVNPFGPPVIGPPTYKRIVPDFLFSKVPNAGLNYSINCEISARDWVASSAFGVSNATEPLRVVCPIQKNVLAGIYGAYLNDYPECGLVGRNDFNVVSLGPVLKDFYFMTVDVFQTCSSGKDQYQLSPMDKCLNDRVSFPFWDPNSFDAGGNQPVSQKVPPPLRLHRLPAIRLSDIEKNATGCRAKWDPSIPVRCGIDKQRFLNAKLGSRGQIDTESWPARDANNATATTAVVELFDDGGEIKVKCSPRWLNANGSGPQSATVTPVITSNVISQSAGPAFAGERTLAFSNVATELLDGVDPLPSVSFTNAYPADTTSTTAYNRYLPRVVACQIKAFDPANDGRPVYAVGVYVAVANASAPLGIEFRPNFQFPLV